VLLWGSFEDIRELLGRKMWVMEGEDRMSSCEMREDQEPDQNSLDLLTCAMSGATLVLTGKVVADNITCLLYP